MQGLSISRSKPGAHAFAAVLLVGLVTAAPAFAQSPWQKNAEWISIRAGYAKSTVEGSPDGNIGAGFGYTRFRNSKWSYGAFAHFELLGRFRRAAEIEVPWTIELVRHYRLPTTVRPYLGVGGGAFWHTVYRTGQDASDIRPGGYLTMGANTPVSDHSLLGLDVRVVVEGNAQSVNPVFRNDKSNASRWSVKLNWTRVL